MLVTYEKADGVAKVSMDDGKVNVMSTAMLSELTTAFERAEKDGVIVILTSARQGIFSAGFDTKILARKDPQGVFEMVKLGAELAARVLAFPRPVVAACPGHAYPMGAFLLLASDIRIGADGPYRIGLNEVAIGIPVPSFGLELAHHRLLPAYLQRTALTGEMFAPSEAMKAGFLDRVVATENYKKPPRPWRLPCVKYIFRVMPRLRSVCAGRPWLWCVRRSIRRLRSKTTDEGRWA